jgi:hypothetical protein
MPATFDQRVLDAIETTRNGQVDRSGATAVDHLLDEIHEKQDDAKAFDAVVRIFRTRPKKDQRFWAVMRAFLEGLDVRDRDRLRRLWDSVNQKDFPSALAAVQVLRLLAQRGMAPPPDALSNDLRWMMQAAPLVYADIAVIVGARSALNEALETAISCDLIIELSRRLSSWQRQRPDYFPELISQIVLICRRYAKDPQPIVDWANIAFPHELDLADPPIQAEPFRPVILLVLERARPTFASAPFAFNPLLRAATP